MNGLIDHQCEVYESGYEIVTLNEVMEEQFAVTSVIEYEDNTYIRPIDPKSTKRILNLADYPGAYNELVDAYVDCLSAHPYKFDFLIKFTNKYGLMTNPSHSERVDNIWLSNIEEMSYSVSLLEKIKTGYLKGFKDSLIIEDGKFKIDSAHSFLEDDEIVESYVLSLTIKGRKLKMDSFGRLFEDDEIVDSYSEIPTVGQTPPRTYSEVAYHYICNVVNKNLKDTLTTEIIVNSTNTGTDMIVRPKNLLSALWLQIAHMVSRNLEFKQCADCSTFFEVNSKKRKNEKIYCSDRCRVRVGARKRREKEKAK